MKVVPLLWGTSMTNVVTNTNTISTATYKYKHKCNTKWWWLLVSGGGILSGTPVCSSAASGPINALIQMQTRQYCPSTQCNQRMLTLYILNGETCFFTQRKKNAFSALGVVCWDEREQETVRPIYASVCLSAPKTRKYLVCLLDNTAFWHTGFCTQLKLWGQEGSV